MTKQTKIIISVLLSCTFLLFLFIPSFASDDSVIVSGTYLLDESFSLDGTDFKLADVPLQFQIKGRVDNELIVVDLGAFGVYLGSEYPSLTGIAYQIEDSIQSYFVYTPSDGWFNANVPFTSDELRTVYVTEDFTSNPEFSSWFNSHSVRIDYTGNPFVDTMNLIIEALDIPIFGTFSIWDMLTTLCGLFAVVWLLKLLAGG